MHVDAMHRCHRLMPQGWQTATTYMARIAAWVEDVRKAGIPFPIILEMDGHKTHFGEDVLAFLVANQV